MDNKRFQLPLNLGQLDFSNWMIGLVSAFISGGAGAVITGTGVMTVDPVHFASHPWMMFRVYAITFLSTGFFSMMNFLHQKPVPLTLTTYQKVTEDASGKETTKIQVQSSLDVQEPKIKDGTKDE